jgi:hypothetical protein
MNQPVLPGYIEKSGYTSAKFPDIYTHNYPDCRFSFISEPIHNRRISDTIVSLCIPLLRLAHPERIDILGGHILTIRVWIRFRDYVIQGLQNVGFRC